MDPVSAITAFPWFDLGIAGAFIATLLIILFTGFKFVQKILDKLEASQNARIEEGKENLQQLAETARLLHSGIEQLKASDRTSEVLENQREIKMILRAMER